VEMARAFEDTAAMHRRALQIYQAFSGSARVKVSVSARSAGTG
jgi:hypothetical protein